MYHAGVCLEVGEVERTCRDGRRVLRIVARASQADGGGVFRVPRAVDEQCGGMVCRCCGRVIGHGDFIRSGRCEFRRGYGELCVVFAYDLERQFFDCSVSSCDTGTLIFVLNASNLDGVITKPPVGGTTSASPVLMNWKSSNRTSQFSATFMRK